VTLRAGLTAVAAAALCADLLGAFEPKAPGPRYDLVYSTEVPTPHVPWATRLPGGPLRGFFIPSVSQGRDMVELMQRLSLAATTVTIDRQWDVNCWGIGDFYGHEYRGDRDDFQTVYGYVEQELTSDKRFEVMLIPGLNGWSRLTRASRDAILRRVSEGAGLVLIHPFVGDAKGHPFKGDEAEEDRRIWDVSPLVGVPDDLVSERGYPELNQGAITQARWERAGRHFITEGLPLELIPSGRAGGRFYNYEARGDVLIQAEGRPILATKTYGKGRVVALSYVEDGFLPETIDPVEAHVSWGYWEYQYALLVRSLLWAAGRESGLSLATPRLDAKEPPALVLDLRSNQTRDVEIDVTARSEFGGVLGAHQERRTLVAGASSLRVPESSLCPKEGWPGGRVALDVIVRDAANGSTLDFGTGTFEVPKAATVTGVQPNARVYRVGDTMSVVTRAAGELGSVVMRLEVRDDLGRLLHREEKQTPGEKTFFYALDDFVGKRASLTASLVAEGRIIDQLQAEPVVVVQRERRQKDYQGLLSFEAPRHFQASLRQRRLRDLAMDSGFTWGGKVNDSLEVPRGWFGVYWYDRGPTAPEALDQAIRDYERTGDAASLQYLTRKELYRRTGDKKFLVRSPSLDDPDVLRTLADVGRTAARNKAVYNMDYYFVGDEGSLTSYADPVDFCFGPHTLANFRKWLQGRYGTLATLNRAWQAAYSDWGAVVPSTTEQARKTGVFPPWADHRTYMEVSFANAYRTVRDAVLEGDPLGHIALSGTQVTTPWNGADWSRLDLIVDDFLSYDGGNQWDMHRSFAKPGARVGFWTGYGRSGVGVRHEIWSAALQGVLFPNLFWSYSVVNPDLTWSRSGRDMGAVFQSLRFEGVGMLLMESQRLGDGIAVHYSMASVHAAGILGFHDRGKKDDDDDPGFPANRDGWVRALTDIGLSFDFVSSPEMESGVLDPVRFKVVVLPLSLAMSAKEAQAIEAFARAGGTVIADGAPGLMDEHCAWKSAGALNALFGVSTPASEKRNLKTPRGTGDLAPTPEGKAWGLEASVLGAAAPFEADVVAGDGRPLVTIGASPAVFARPVGKGWAIYLNALLDHYPQLRKERFGGAGTRTLLSAILAHAGARPVVRVHDGKGHGVGPTRIARYRFGDAEIVGLLQEPIDLEEMHGRDGVRVYTDSKLGSVVAQEVEIQLPRASDLVNVRTGEFLGHTDRLRTSLVSGDGMVLALGGSRPAVSLSGSPSAARGEHVRFEIHVVPASAKRLVRCHVYGPDGAFRPEHARNLLVDGSTATFVLPTALDDAPGAYRLKVADVVGGGTAEATMDLQ
jgi:hypothetical protein